jgi:cobalt-zinc-cadmium efflux system outer membrane protein
MHPRSLALLAFGLTPLFPTLPASAESIALPALVEKTVANHPELRFYEAEIQAAKAGKKTAGTFKNPDLQTGIGNWRVRDLSTGGVSDGPTWSVTLTQTIEWPGRLALRKAIAQKQIQIAELGLTQFRRTVASQVETRAWQFLAAQEKARVAHEVAHRLEELSNIVLQRDPAGVAPRMEAKIIQASAMTLGAEHSRAQNELDASRFELNRLLGHQPGQALEITREKLVLTPPPSLEKLLATARTQNFELRSRMLEVEQQGFEVALAEKQVWPAITVQPYVQRQTNQTRETQAGIGLSFPLPLLDRNTGPIEAAKARKTQAEVLLNSHLSQLERDVASQESHYRIHVAELAKWPPNILEEFRKVAAEADEHYRLGALPLTTYIELQRQYLESVQAVLTSQLGALEARLALEQLTGTALPR